MLAAGAIGFIFRRTTILNFRIAGLECVSLLSFDYEGRFYASLSLPLIFAMVIFVWFGARFAVLKATFSWRAAITKRLYHDNANSIKVRRVRFREVEAGKGVKDVDVEKERRSG